MEYTFKVNALKGGDFRFELKDQEGNYIYGFGTAHKSRHTGYISKTYHIIGANFNGSRYSKLPNRWKRDKQSSISKAFTEWSYPITKELQDRLPGFIDFN